MTRLLRRWPLMRATYQTYRNVGLEAYRDHREVTLLVLAVVTVCYLALVAVQLQAILPSIDTATLAQLQQDQLGPVVRAASTAVAAVSLGVSLFLGVVGTAGPSLEIVGSYQRIGRLARAWSLHGLDLALASTVGVLVVGPVAAAAAYQSLRVAGSSTGAALTLALLSTLAAAVAGAATALVVTGLVRAAGRSTLSAPSMQAVTVVAQGLVLIVGVALVLAGRTEGLVVLAPPSALGGDALPSAGTAALLLVAAVAWVATAVALVAASPSPSAWMTRSGTTHVRMHRGSPAVRAAVPLALRDPLFVAAALLTVVGAVVLRLLRLTGAVAGPQAAVIVLLLVGVSGLSVITSMHRVAATLWVFRVRPGTYGWWVLRFGGCLQVLSLVMAGAAVAVAGFLDDPAVVALAVANAVLSTSVGTLVSVLVYRRGVSAENRAALVGAGAAGIAAVALVWVAVLQVPAVGDSPTGTLSLLLAASLACVVGAPAAATRMADRS